MTAKVTIGKRRGTPRPHLRTHPKVIASRWTKENHPRGGRKKTSEVTAIIKDGLQREALLDGKKTGLSCAEVVAATTIEESMNGNLAATSLLLDRTEGKVKQAHELSGPGGKEVVFRVIFDDDDQPSGGNTAE